MGVFRIAAGIAAGICLLAAAVYASLMHSTDSRLQRFRAPGASATAFIFIPLRWKRHLYTEEGRALVDAAWRYQRLMFLFGLLGALFAAVAGGRHWQARRRASLG